MYFVSFIYTCSYKTSGFRGTVCWMSCIKLSCNNFNKWSHRRKYIKLCIDYYNKKNKRMKISHLKRVSSCQRQTGGTLVNIFPVLPYWFDSDWSHPDLHHSQHTTKYREYAFRRHVRGRNMCLLWWMSCDAQFQIDENGKRNVF